VLAEKLRDDNIANPFESRQTSLSQIVMTSLENEEARQALLLCERSDT
jgi:hypothetical protein